MYHRLLIIVAILSLFCPNSQGNDEYTLELVHITFRHGSRTPELRELYINNTNAADNYYPYGYGQLTKKGKSEAYQLGKFLNERYSAFLEGSSTIDTVLATSTDFDRTKVTLLLVLAALFPPTSEEAFTSELNWQPIPYQYDHLLQDYTIFKPIKCPAFYRELKRVLNSEEVNQFVQTNRHIIDYIGEHSGRNMSEIRSIFRVHQTLDADAHMNLTLPDWVNKIYPEEIKRLSVQVVGYDHHTDFLKRLYSGRFFKVIIKNIIEKSQRKLVPENRKLFLYSAHDINIIGQLQTLGIFTPVMPKYCSAILYELHRQKTTNKFFVKILHLKNVESGLEEKVLSGCDVLCPLSEFKKIMEPYIPENLTEECDSDILLE